jgi:Co/Zn/Cd efflux system component
MRNLHVGWAWFVITSNGLAGLWSLGAHRLEQLRTRALWWFTLIAELTVFVQVGLGVWLVNHKYVAKEFHMFYGFVAIIAIAIIYSYRQQMAHKLYMLYGLGGLFIMGLGIRAMLIGER